MWNDLRFGLRTLRRSPVFRAVAVLSLALGIGANTSIFSLLSQVMFRLLPVIEPERLVVFHTDGQRQGTSSSDNHEAVFSYPTWLGEVPGRIYRLRPTTSSTCIKR